MEPPIPTELASWAEILKEGGPRADNLFQTIPLDILVTIILNYLDGNDLYALCQTSGYFRRSFCSADPRQVWEQLWRRDVSATAPPINDNRYRADYLWLFGGYQKQKFSSQQVLFAAVEHDLEKYVKSHLPKDQKEIYEIENIAVQSHSLNVVKMLYANGYRSYLDYGSFIAVAAFRGDQAFVNQILANMIDIVGQHSQAFIDLVETATDEAIKSDQLEMFKELLDRYHQQDPEELLGAANYGAYSILEELVQRNIVSPDHILRHIAHWDTWQENVDTDPRKMAKFTIDQLGATDLNAALAEAANSPSNNRLAMVKFLVDQGANNYQQAIDIASQADNQDVVDYLKTKL